MDNNQQQLTNTGFDTLPKILTTPAKTIVEGIAHAVREGVAVPSETFVALKKFNKIYNLIFDSKSNKDFKDIKELLEEEVLKFKEGNAKTFTIHGAKITEANRGYWDYSQTNDPYLQALKQIEKDIKELVKVRETYLQNKLAEYNLQNNPLNISKFGLQDFTISWENLPQLTFEEGYGETATQPPTKRNTSSLRVSL